MRLPSVDVVIPAYNAAKFIEGTLRSVFAQSYPINAVWVINDGSTDDTLAVVHKFKRQFDFNDVLKVYSKKNGGHAAAVNEGIRRCNSEWIALVDSDDIWLREKIADQIELVSRDPKIGWVYTDYDVISEKDELIPLLSERRTRPSVRGWVAASLVKHGNLISGSNSSVLIKRALLQECLFDESFRAGEDLDLWIRLSQLATVDFVDKVLVRIRRHSCNQSSDSMLMFINDIRILAKHKKLVDESDIEIAFRSKLDALPWFMIWSNFRTIYGAAGSLNLGFGAFVSAVLFTVMNRLSKRLYGRRSPA